MILFFLIELTVKLYDFYFIFILSYLKLGCLQTGRICEVNGNNVDVFWIANGELYLKRLNIQDIVRHEKKIGLLKSICNRICSKYLLLSLIIIVIFCNGLMHFYYQLENRYFECLVNKESWLVNIFYTNHCENKVSLFNVCYNLFCFI